MINSSIMFKAILNNMAEKCSTLH